MKRGVLGIDAAWTERAPSGVAWLVEDARGWHVAGCAPSYAEFRGLAAGREVDWSVSGIGTGEWPDIESLLAAAQQIERAEASVIAIDMPLAIGQCVARRKADNLISSAFGAQGCSTHSPTPERPGEMGMDFMRQLDAVGFPLAVLQPTSDSEPGSLSGTHSLEVYPHPALLRLLNESYRLKYKVSRSAKFWRGESVRARIGHLLEAFGRIAEGLRNELGELPVELPEVSGVKTLASLKRYEDALDSLVCAWVGVRFLEGRADGFGDASAVIWVPAEESS